MFKLHKSFWFQLFDAEMVTSLFFVICGIQTSISLTSKILRSSNNWILFKKLVTKSFDKLVTLSTVFLLIHSTILPRWLGSGPFWKSATAKDFVNCRNSWRMNLLTINNYANHEDNCMESSWILSVEFHMMIVGVIVLYCLVKWPKARKATAAGSLAISFAVIVAEFHAKKLSSFALSSPE